MKEIKIIKIISPISSESIFKYYSYRNFLQLQPIECIFKKETKIIESFSLLFKHNLCVYLKVCLLTFSQVGEKPLNSSKSDPSLDASNNSISSELEPWALHVDIESCEIYYTRYEKMKFVHELVYNIPMVNARMRINRWNT